MKIPGRVSGGKFKPDVPAVWPIAMVQYEGKDVVIEVSLKTSARSLRQNSRFWSLLVPLAGHYLSQTRDVPLSKEQVKFVLCSAFLGCEETSLGLVPMRTSILTTQQFAQFCEKVERWLSDAGYSVPDGPEVSVVQTIDEATA